MIEQFTIWKKDVWGETDGGLNPEDYHDVHRKSEFYIVRESEEEAFGESMASDYGDQDYNYKIKYKKLATMTGNELEYILTQFKSFQKFMGGDDE